MTKNVIQRQSDTSIVHCLVTLETIVTDIKNCCDIDHAEKFKKTKGLIAGTKTTFDKAKIDSDIEKPYGDAMTAISNLESYLNDL